MQATVMDIRLESRRDGIATWQILLDAAVHNVSSILARSANGASLSVQVLRSFEEDGFCWVVTEKPLPVGTAVEVHSGNNALADPSL